jgi:hypothetical protein
MPSLIEILQIAFEKNAGQAIQAADVADVAADVAADPETTQTHTAPLYSGS